MDQTITCACTAYGTPIQRCEVHKQAQEAFDTIKRIMQKEVLLAYPDFSKPFEIHTDASHTQLGAVIAQEGQPIAFYLSLIHI